MGTDLGRGLRKIRMAITSKGKGKSGGARVITLVTRIDVDSSEIILYQKNTSQSIFSFTAVKIQFHCSETKKVG